MSLHRKAFTHRKLLHMGTFYTEKLLQTEALLQGSFLHSAPCTCRMAAECTKYFPVLLCTTSREGTYQYYFVLQDLHKVLLSSTLYYKTCTNDFPVLPCTAKLAQSTSQYYFVLQSLHREGAQKSLHTASFYIKKLLHRDTFTQRQFYTETVLHTKLLHGETFTQRNFLHVASFCTQHAFIQSKLLHTGSFYTLQSFTHRKLSHTLGYTPKGEDEMR